jgi:hypothetical protein
MSSWNITPEQSNVESTNAAIKRKFGETLKSKNQIAQVNELLAKIIAYNLTVIIHEMYENGISPDFLHIRSGDFIQNKPVTTVLAVTKEKSSKKVSGRVWHFTFHKYDAGDEDCEQRHRGKHLDRIRAGDIVHDDLPHEDGEPGNEKRPHVNVSGPEIDRHGLKEDDDGDREQEGVNYLYKVVCKVVGYHHRADQPEGVVNRKYGNDSE